MTNPRRTPVWYNGEVIGQRDIQGGVEGALGILEFLAMPVDDDMTEPPPERSALLRITDLRGRPHLFDASPQTLVALAQEILLRFHPATTETILAELVQLRDMVSRLLPDNTDT